MNNLLNHRLVHAAPLQNLAVFDLDNCISDDGWRFKYIDWTASNPDDRWRVYHEMSYGDKPANLEVFHAVVAVSGFYPVFITARTEAVRAATESWLRQNLGVERFTLLMRAEGDHRPTLQVKVEHVRSLPRQPVLAYDDREDIISAYHDLDIDAKVLRVHSICMMTPPPGVTAARLLTDRRTAKGVPLEPGEADSWTVAQIADAFGVPESVLVPGPSEEPMPLAPPTRGEGLAPAKAPVASVANGMAEVTSSPEAWDLAQDLMRAKSHGFQFPFCPQCQCGGKCSAFGRCELEAQGVYAADPVPRTAADILIEMGETFRERNKVYGSNYKMVGPLVKVLFPDGVPPELVASHRWHLFELKLVKLSRFAISKLTHLDSIHDDAVYSAMIESILTNGEDK